MDRWLDDLARSVADRRLSRRTILRRLLPGAVAGAVGLRLAGHRAAEAACPPGQTACGLACFDLQSNPQSCGSCFHACGFGQLCTQGVCLMPNGCPPEQTLCAGHCSDLNSDPANCGGCGRACPAGQVCQHGGCTPPPVGCSGDQVSCGGACTSLASDPHNCGACGHACPPGAPLCSGGQCAAGCAPAYTACSGRCVNTLSDTANCGGCGHACAGGSCRSGVCTGQAQATACTAGSQCQSGFCVGGVCCSSACNQGCGTCASGSCTPVAAGTVCTTSAAFVCSGSSIACPTSCTTNSQCNSAGGFSCVPSTGQCVAGGSQGVGSACSGSSQCQNGLTCSSGRCLEPSGGNCTGDAQCASGTTCNTTSNVCVTNGSVADGGSCSENGQCQSGLTCSGGHCLRPQGGACTTNSNCATGFCANQVCCDTACNQGCGSCAGGSCTAVAVGTVCTTSSAFVCLGGSVACPSSCTSDGQCNIAGGFSCDRATSSCIADGSVAQGGVCSADRQCATGNYCALSGQTGTCTAQLGAGATCQSNNQCLKHDCIGGTCGGAPPTCRFTSERAGPPQQIDLTVQDTDDGIASIVVTQSMNADTPEPSFTTGDTSPIVVTATKVDNTKPATVTLQVTDVGGNVTTCTQTFPVPTCSFLLIAGPPTQLQITVQQDTAGLQSIVVTRSDNADTPVPPFTVGTTDPVVITATKIDQSWGSLVSIDVTDLAGDKVTCARAFVGPYCAPIPPIATQNQLTVTVEDPVGLKSIIITQSDNANSAVSQFFQGDTGPVDATATKLNQAQQATLTLNATDEDGNSSTCSWTF